MSDTQDKVRAKEQAKAQLEGVQSMVKRLEHCRDCTVDEGCELTDKEIYEGINLHYQEGDKATEEDIAEYHNEEKAREAITEDPLSVQVRSDWHSPGVDSGNAEYRICLCTGGPAVQIIGSLDEHGEPETAEIQYQDWFTPWIDYTTDEEEDQSLLTYAQQFYFGEG